MEGWCGVEKAAIKSQIVQLNAAFGGAGTGVPKGTIKSQIAQLNGAFGGGGGGQEQDKSSNKGRTTAATEAVSADGLC